MKKTSFKPKELILTAGPSISQKEISYVSDAVKNGWNFHLGDYIEKFQDKFAEYLGVKYAIAVTSGTAALHLAMRVMDIGPGDEVIIPDQTFVSCANVVRWVGATPVFCDVEEDTWCLNPESFKKAITKRTKAVMPIHTYGQAPRMDEIVVIAKKHNIKVVEDACPAVGSLYKNKPSGNKSDIAAFSFQGAKIMVTGEGGMFVTNSKTYYEKAFSLHTHGRDMSRTFWHDDIGYMYRMSNIQAALGLAQLERLGQLVAKKQKIFGWYKNRLKNLENIQLNTENNWSKSNYWMSSLILGKDVKISREEFQKKLRDKKIDTRPFFYPITMFPMYKKNKRVDTSVSYYLGLKGINLPSGFNLTEKEIDYISSQVINLLR